MSIEASSTTAQPETVENPEELNQIDHDETPRCEIHPKKEAESECDQCGRRICGIDMKKSGTIEICEECFLEDAQDEELGHGLVWPMAIVPIFAIIGLFLALGLGEAL